MKFQKGESIYGIGVWTIKELLAVQHYSMHGKVTSCYVI